MHRRTAMKMLSATAALPLMPRGLQAQQGERTLQMLPVLDTPNGARIELAATVGQTRFAGREASRTIGYNGSYLGPLVRVGRGEVPTVVENRLDEPITTHWHGLMVRGELDGGPHSLIRPGGRWDIVLPIDQPPATLWYHSHVHGLTAPQVYSGLAGVLQVVDGEDEARGLPTYYGTDDLTLVIQDRRFEAGRMVYNPTMPDIMQGFTGDTILVNGQVGRTAAVPPGVVRLRLLNASNGRIYPLSMASGREMHLIATDAGHLDAPVALDEITLGPGERAEVLVDLSGAESDALVSEDTPNAGMMMRGMMGRMMGRSDAALGDRFEVLPFAVDARLDARIDSIPDALGGSMPDLAGRAETTREISLDMGMMGPGGMGGGIMGGGMMGRGMMGGGMMGGGRDQPGSRSPDVGSDIFGINGQPFDMERLNFAIPKGAVERWIVTSSMLMHPFHIHGVAFEVVSEGGRPPRPQNRGWKDTVLVIDQVELIARFVQPASRETPFMFHCHILEHEDHGMMGQFTVG